MISRVRAGIELQGSVLRYAEIEETDQQYKVLRLGTCDFDFNVENALLRSDNIQWIRTIASALKDVFEGSTATRLLVTVHPTSCTSFFVPVPESSTADDRTEQLDWEAKFIGGYKTPQEYRIAVEPAWQQTMSDKSHMDWLWSVVIEEKAFGQLSQVVQTIPQFRYQFRLNTQAIARTIRRLDIQDPPSLKSPNTLAIGWYDSHIEYTLMQNGACLFSHHTAAGTHDDCAYFAATLLKRMHIKPLAVGKLLLYGENIDLAKFDLIARLFDLAPQRLDPLSSLPLVGSQVPTSFPSEAYASCISAIV